jgi:hypothetical protein
MARTGVQIVMAALKANGGGSATTMFTEDVIEAPPLTERTVGGGPFLLGAVAVCSQEEIGHVDLSAHRGDTLAEFERSMTYAAKRFERGKWRFLLISLASRNQARRWPIAGVDRGGPSNSALELLAAAQRWRKGMVPQN